MDNYTKPFELVESKEKNRKIDALDLAKMSSEFNRIKKYKQKGKEQGGSCF